VIKESKNFERKNNVQAVETNNLECTRNRSVERFTGHYLSNFTIIFRFHSSWIEIQDFSGPEEDKHQISGLPGFFGTHVNPV